MQKFLCRKFLALFLYGTILNGLSVQVMLTMNQVLAEVSGINNLSQEKRVVSVPVADIFFLHDQINYDSQAIADETGKPGFYTHALMGEQLEVIERCGDDLYVRLLEQRHYSGDLLKPCSGIIKANQTVIVDDFSPPSIVIKEPLAVTYEDADLSSKKLISLSCGTKLTAIRHDANWWRAELPDGLYCFILDKSVIQLCYNDQDERTEGELRDRIVSVVKSMIGMGCHSLGRSFGENCQTGVGCSGLINLVYRACGIDIPRFPEDIYHFGDPLDGNELKPGDLIFIVRCNDEAIWSEDKQTLNRRCLNMADPHHVAPHHVAMYVGDEDLVEACYNSSPRKDNPVHSISCKRYLQKSLVDTRDCELKKSLITGRYYAVCFCRIVQQK